MMPVPNAGLVHNSSLPLYAELIGSDTCTAAGITPLSALSSNGWTAADTAARDAAIACSIALQFGADMETIRKALCRDSRGNASGPLGVALDVIARDTA